MIILQRPEPITEKIEIVTDERTSLERFFGGGQDKIRKLSINRKTHLSDLIVRSPEQLIIGAMIVVPDFAARTLYHAIPYEACSNDIYRCHVEQGIAQYR